MGPAPGNCEESEWIEAEAERDGAAVDGLRGVSHKGEARSHLPFRIF